MPLRRLGMLFGVYLRLPPVLSTSTMSTRLPQRLQLPPSALQNGSGYIAKCMVITVMGQERHSRTEARCQKGAIKQTNTPGSKPKEKSSPMGGLIAQNKIMRCWGDLSARVPCLIIIDGPSGSQTGREI